MARGGASPARGGACASRGGACAPRGGACGARGEAPSRTQPGHGTTRVIKQRPSDVCTKRVPTKIMRIYDKKVILFFTY